MPEFVTMGETLAVFVAADPGPLRYATYFQRKTGGAETNVAVGITRLGHTAGWITRLGDDEFGHLIHATMKGEGLDLSRVRFDGEHPTGVFFKERREFGESRNYYYRKGSAAAHMSSVDVDGDYIRSARLIHLTGITAALSDSCLAAVREAIRIARQAGVVVSFDPNLRLKLWSGKQAKSILIDLMAQADILLPGLEEAQYILGVSEPDAIIEELLALGPRLVALKLGSDGAIIGDKHQIQHVPAFHVARIVDPFGAGDAFAAGFLAGWMEGLDLVSAGRLGNACGACAMTVTGNIEALPTRNEVTALMAGSQSVTTR